MGLSRVGTATGTTSCTVPVHAIGDLIVIFAFNSTSTTIPTLPAGFTSWRTQVGTTCAGRVGYKIATATNDASGTWTNAKALACIVYTGSPTVSSPDILNNNSASQTTTTINYPALSGVAINGRSWTIGCVGQATTSSLATSNPAGMSNVVSAIGTASIAMHDTGAPSASAWTAKNGTAAAAGNSVSFSLELVDQQQDGWDPLNVGRGAINTAAVDTISGTDDTTCVLAATAHDQTATTGHASGKFYFEMTCVTQGTSDGSIGVEGNAGALSVVWADSGNAPPGAFYNGAGTQVGSMTNATAGQVVGVSVDATSGKVWFQNVTTSSQYNGNGTDDPNTGAGGLTYTATTVYPMIGAATASSGKWTLNTGTSAFTGSLPTGYSAWYQLPTTTTPYDPWPQLAPILAMSWLISFSTKISLLVSSMVGAMSARTRRRPMLRSRRRSSSRTATARRGRSGPSTPCTTESISSASCATTLTPGK